MQLSDSRIEGQRTVVYLGKPGSDPAGHEAVTQRALARKLAELQGNAFGGDVDVQIDAQNVTRIGAAFGDGTRLYFVPADTLCADIAATLGVRGEQDLFGGVVPYSFVATKTITHGLVDAQAQAPPGWSPNFAAQVHEVVLPGYSAFRLDDALTAGKHLLAHGPVRIKLAVGVGGLCQAVAHDVAALEQILRDFDAEGALTQGVVLEPHLEEIATYSVGRARIGGLVLTYYGQQRLTRDNHGAEVYGGSDLVLVRGDFDILLQHQMAPHLRTALEQASVYHAAAQNCYPGLFASRCNYDVAQGRDQAGAWHSGVLEQSWRIGGASGAELAAIEAFRNDPALRSVRASTAEVYEAGAAETVEAGGEMKGEAEKDNTTEARAAPIPADATIYFCGDDPRVGRLTKYAWIEGHDDT